MTANPTIYARINQELYDQLEKWAEEEGRTKSNLIAFLLQKAVGERQKDREV